MPGGKPPRLRAACLFVAAIAVLVAATPTPLAAQNPDPDRATRLMDDLMWARGRVGGPFNLIDQTGKQRTDAEFRGKLLIVYFGYTTCPDICPSDLMQIGLAIDQLGAAGNEVQPIFISVDPERDTPEVLTQYVSSFHRRLIGLTGTPQQIRAVADAYKAYYAKYVPESGGVYLIDHTGFTYFMGRSGEFLGFFPPGTSADRMVEIVRQHLADQKAGSSEVVIPQKRP
jgi:cytochrome oxidase Cu insertion factor (SCO1/SenC/PrrC family)